MKWERKAARTVEVVKPACTVLRLRGLGGQPFDWPDLIREEPEALPYRPAPPYELRLHRRALDDVLAPLALRDRRKRVMACGTPCYIAAVNIEEAHRGPRSEGAEHEPFGGIVLADTFHLSSLPDGFLKLFLPDNGERVERQDNLPVQVSSRPFNLQGKQRTQGEHYGPGGRRAFGQGSRALPAPDYRERVANESKGGR